MGQRRLTVDASDAFVTNSPVGAKANSAGQGHATATSVDAALGQSETIVEENAHKGYDPGKEEPRELTTIGSQHIVHLHIRVIPSECEQRVAVE